MGGIVIDNVGEVKREDNMSSGLLKIVEELGDRSLAIVGEEVERF